MQKMNSTRGVWTTTTMAVSRKLNIGISCDINAPAQGKACKRRKFLLDAAVLATADLAGRVDNADAIKMLPNSEGGFYEAFEFDVPLRVVALSGSTPGEWEQDFRDAMQGRVKLQLDRRRQLLEIYQELENPNKKNSAGRADAVTLGDAFFGPAIAGGLIQPIDRAEVQHWWEALSPRWQTLIRRDREGRLCKRGQIWGVPYKWGCSLIACHRGELKSKKVAWPITDWSDLLQPALKGRLGFVDSPRDFVAAVLKTLGLSINTSAAQLADCGIARDTVLRRAAQLRQQILQVSSREQQQALQSGDLWAAVGPSSTLIPLAMRQNKINLVVPSSGTMLWSHLWVVPNGSRISLPKGQSLRASRKKGLHGGASPLLLPGGPNHEQCQARPTGESLLLGSKGSLTLDLGSLMPSDSVLRQSEFLVPMDEDTRELYCDILEAT